MKTFKNTHNPILPLEYHIPDSEAHVFSDGRLYLYGSLDELADAWCSTRYHVVSADMKTWTVHETVFRGEDVPWYRAPAPQGKDSGISEGKTESNLTPPSAFMKRREETADAKELAKTPGLAPELPCLYAPDCMEKDGKYYLYFCMADGSEGVAVSERPEGPFRDPVRLPAQGIDPAVFMDRDGKAYYFWGQIRPFGVPLNPDMKSFDPEKVVPEIATEEEHFFHEGASMRKIKDMYYLVFSDIERGRPTSLGYATAASPLGPFTYRGIIIDNTGCDPSSWNDHGSIECVNGQWYVFYHRSSRNTQLYRRLCIEPITINADGSIDEVPMTSQGPGEPFGPGEKIMAYQACGLSGSCYIDADEKVEESLQHIEAGDSAVFRYVKSDQAFKKAVLEFEGAGRVRILLDGKEVGEAILQGDQAGKACSAEISLEGAAAGCFWLKLVFEEAKDLKLISVTLM